MKMRRLLSVLLAVALVMSCLSVGIVATSAAEADYADTAADVSLAAAGSAYSDMLASTTAENKYGLSDTVNDGTILQAWTWSFANITANLETIAEQGFTTIQVSPPNEIKSATKGAKFLQSDNNNGWWMYYQPVGFQLNESTDNALGTKSEFVSMCEKAHALGLKVIVDAVINHVGTKDGDNNNTSTDPMSHVNPKVATYEPEIYNNKLFHSPWKQMQYIEANDTQYNSTYDLTRNCTSGLPDLKTEDSRVQAAIYDYMEELITAGADGFRFDAAKHIETPDDISSLRSDFWTNTLVKVQKAHPDQEIYAYGEILNSCGISRPYSMYTKLFDVTDSGSYWGIKNVVTGEYSGNATPYYPSTNFTAANAVLWDESHDTYVDGSTTSLNTTQRGKIWALVAGRAGISSVYLARPDDGTSTSALYSITLGEARKTAWSNATTKAINQFHNYFIGQGEYCTANSGGTAYIERGTTGAMIVNLGGTTSKSVTLANHKLTPGTYKDAITGNEFTVTSSQIKGQVGATGVAAIYENTYVAPTEPPVTYILGDVNDDGVANAIDATLIMRNAIGTHEFDDVQKLAADVDGDGYITVIDATFVQRYDAKMTVKYDIGVEKVYNPTPVTPTTPYVIPTNPDTNPTNPYTPIDGDGGRIIFSNNKGFSTVNIYYWASGSEGPVAWPGTAMTYLDTNEYGESRYYFDMPAGYDHYIINDGSQQTVDIEFTGTTGVYMTEQDAEGHYNVDFYAVEDTPVDPVNPTTPYTPIDTDGGRIIFSNNKGFSTVNIYYWATGSEGPVAWPGTAMTYLDTNEYGETRYYFDMPAGYDHYIINDGSQQTVDIEFTGTTGVYMTEQDAEGHYNVDFYAVDDTPVDPVTPTQPDTPIDTDGGRIIFSNNKGFSTVNIYYWATGSEGPVAWPGTAMTYLDTNEYGETRYYFDMPSGYDHYIINDGNQQTVDVTFTGTTGVYMTEQDAEGHYNVDFYAVDDTPVDPVTPTQPDTPIDTDGGRIVFSNNKGFQSVNIYYWATGSEGPVAWPGTPMTYFDTNEYGENRYYFDMPAGYDHYIINDGTQQTVDVTFSGTTGVYMTDEKDAEGHYEVGFYELTDTEPSSETPVTPTQPDTPIDTDGGRIVFSNNKGFQSVNIYYWATGSEGPVAWPGTPMTYFDTNEYGENRYYFDMPAGYDHYIINDGTQQTVDVTFSGTTGVYMTDEKDAEGHYEVGFYELTDTEPSSETPVTPTQPDTPIDTDGGRIVFSNNKGFQSVNIYYWATGSEGPAAWPGTPMTYFDTNEYGENRYYFDMPAGYDHYIINDGTQQTVDVTFSGTTGVYMTDEKDAEGHYEVGFYELTDTEPSSETPVTPTQPDTPIDTDGGRIVFSNNKGFQSVNIYYWATGSEGPAAWPGTPMTYFDTNEYGENRYYFDMPAGYDHYIINDGTQQTVDVTFSGTTGVYMTDEKDAEGHYEVGFYELTDTEPSSETPVTPTQPDTPSGNDITFVPGDAATADPAWFAWVWGNGNDGTWIAGTASGSNVIFAGAGNYSDMVIVRMPTGSTSGNWDTKWNQSQDLTISGTTATFTDWNGGTFKVSWS